MIIVRFKIRCIPDKTEEMMAAMGAVVAPSRALPGVIHFDVARDVTDPDSLIATEVFDDRAAMERQEAQPEVARVIELIGAGALSGAPEWTIYEVASAESPQM
jgi:quinol monooxygenase YgiN